MAQFQSRDLDHTPQFSLSGYEGWARLVDCYDGDTVKLVLPVLTEWYVFSCRLIGVNAPELKTRDMVQHAKAQHSRNRLLEWCTGQCPPSTVTPKDIRTLLQAQVCLVWVQCFDFEKYGRVLVQLKKSPQDVHTLNQRLVEEGYAVSYLEKN